MSVECIFLIFFWDSRRILLIFFGHRNAKDTEHCSTQRIFKPFASVVKIAASISGNFAFSGQYFRQKVDIYKEARLRQHYQTSTSDGTTQAEYW